MNGMTPGPPIHVCVNDIVIAVVSNKVPGQDLGIHWHGIEQKGTPFMDGVPMVTQCPISYGSSYKYSFRASSPGTFFYHADSGNLKTLETGLSSCAYDLKDPLFCFICMYRQLVLNTFYPVS